MKLIFFFWSFARHNTIPELKMETDDTLVKLRKEEKNNVMMV
jgi:hypothetical protein